MDKKIHTEGVQRKEFRVKLSGLSSVTVLLTGIKAATDIWPPRQILVKVLLGFRTQCVT